MGFLKVFFYNTAFIFGFLCQLQLLTQFINKKESFYFIFPRNLNIFIVCAVTLKKKKYLYLKKKT